MPLCHLLSTSNNSTPHRSDRRRFKVNFRDGYVPRVYNLNSGIITYRIRQCSWGSTRNSLPAIYGPKFSSLNFFAQKKIHLITQYLNPDNLYNPELSELISSGTILHRNKAGVRLIDYLLCKLKNLAPNPRT